MKRILLLLLLFTSIYSCYNVEYVGISDRYMGTFRSREPILGDGYDKYLYVNVKSGGVIIFFAHKGFDEDISGMEGYERIEYINFIGDGNVYNLYNNDYSCKLVFRSEKQVEVTMKGQGIFNLDSVVCDKT